jgi:hypothetical protein
MDGTFQRTTKVASVILCPFIACCGGPASTPQAAASPDRVPVRVVTTLPGTGWIEGVLTDTNGVAPVVGGSVGVPIVLEAEGATSVCGARRTPAASTRFAI